MKKANKKSLLIVAFLILASFVIMSNKKEVDISVDKIIFDDLCNTSFEIKNNTDDQVVANLKLSAYDASSKAHAGGVVGSKAVKVSLNSREIKNIQESISCTPMRSTIMGVDVFVLEKENEV